MKCEQLVVAPGVMAIVCSRGRRRKAPPCSVPGCDRDSVSLCDFPVTREGREGTCDKELCSSHRTHVGTDLDYCPAHSRRPVPENRRPADPEVHDGRHGRETLCVECAIVRARENPKLRAEFQPKDFWDFWRVLGCVAPLHQARVRDDLRRRWNLLNPDTRAMWKRAAALRAKDIYALQALIEELERSNHG